MSILLDTNVLSELLRISPDVSVLNWVEGQAPDSLYVSTVTCAEMMFGARRLPAGKRRSALEGHLSAMFEEEFAQRIFPFDTRAAMAYADVMSTRRSSGRPIMQFDGQIAAIAISRGARLATRNVSDFDGCGLTVIDPWRATTQ